MTEYMDILNEADEEGVESTTSTEPAVAETTVEATPEAAPAVESRTGEEPAPDGGTNTAATPAPLTREDGATWSEKAKRWYLDGKIVAGEPPVTEPKVEQALEAVAPVVEAPKVETPAPIAEPFTFRANGQKHAIAGLTVAPEQQELVRSLLVDGMNHRQNFGRMQAEWKQKVTQAEAMGGAKVEKYNKASVYLFDKISQLLAENPAELEMTKRELALMLKEADLSVPKTAAEPEQNDEALEQGARSTLAGYVQELFEDTADAKTLLDLKDITDAFQSRLQAYFVEHDGEIVLDTFAAKKDFDRELAIHKRAHQAKLDAARVAQQTKAAAAFNRDNKPTPSQPPAPSRPKPVLATVPSGAPTKKPWDQAIKDAFGPDDDDE